MIFVYLRIVCALCRPTPTMTAHWSVSAAVDVAPNGRIRPRRPIQYLFRCSYSLRARVASSLVQINHISISTRDNQLFSVRNVLIITVDHIWRLRQCPSRRAGLERRGARERLSRSAAVPVCAMRIKAIGKRIGRGRRTERKKGVQKRLTSI